MRQVLQSLGVSSTHTHLSYHPLTEYSSYLVLNTSSTHHIQYFSYLVLTISSTHHIQYSPYLVLTTSSTHYIQYSPYRVLTISSSHHIQYSPYLVLTISSTHHITQYHTQSPYFADSNILEVHALLAITVRAQHVNTGLEQGYYKASTGLVQGQYKLSTD